MQGDAAWSLVVALTKSEATTYLNDRQAKGFNVLMVELIENKFSSDPPRNTDGVAPFTGAAFGTPNEAYFQHVDWLVAQARQRGMTLLLFPAYLGYGGGDEGWMQEMTTAGTDAMRAYGSFVGARYRDDPNIVWAMGGDYNASEPGQKALVEALADGIASADPDHLMTAHTSRGYTASSIWGSEPWLDIDNVYSDGPPAGDTAAAYGAGSGRPLFYIEGIYENEHGADTALMRNQAWSTVLSGASGHIFGNNPIWHFGSSGLFPAPVTWRQALDGPGSKSMAVLRSLLDSIPWHRLAPDRSDRFLVGGEQSGMSRAAAATSAADGLALVYVPSSRTITVDLGRLTTDTVRLRWFDPTNGNTQAIGTYSTSGQRDLSTPGSNAGGDSDWVLVVDAPSSGGGGGGSGGGGTGGGGTGGGGTGGTVSDWPVRLLDTRTTNATIDNLYSGAGLRPARSVTEVQITGRGGIPTNATSAILNLTITNPTEPGYATVYPCGNTTPDASNINYQPGDTVANAVITDLGPNGTICIYTHAPTHLIIDASAGMP